MAKAEANVEELVGMIERGELRLPEMQRRYVWQATRVRDLMDSLYRGYPSGAILIWETDEAVPLRDFAVVQNASPYQTAKLLLDGQQRLTSLAAVLRGQPIKVRWRKKPIELLFNLNHPDHMAVVTEVDENAENDDDAELTDETDADENELQARLEQMTFVVHSPKLARLAHWVPVSQVFKAESDAQFLKKAGVTGFDDPRYEKYSQRLARLRAIRKYVYRMDVLERTLSYEEVTEIFVRVNSLGAKLRGSDLAMAQITAKWKDSLKVFEAFQTECTDNGFDLDLGVHVKNLVAYATGQSRFHTVGSLKMENLKTAWGCAQEGFRFAINFLKSNAGVESIALLSSPFLLISLGYFGHHCNYSLSPKEAAELRYWLYAANAKGRYSRGSSETLLDQDLARIHDGKGVAGLLETLKQQFGRLDIQPGDLESRNARSAYFKTMFLAFREDGAKDWTSNLTISLSHGGKQHKLEFHHIFPRANIRDLHKPAVVNDIANFAFIGGKTNRKISNKLPADYIPGIVEKQGKSILTAQCIPTKKGLLTIDKYLDFLAERRKLIAARLNKFLEDARRVDTGTTADHHQQRIPMTFDEIINYEFEPEDIKAAIELNGREGDVCDCYCDKCGDITPGTPFNKDDHCDSCTIYEHGDECDCDACEYNRYDLMEEVRLASVYARREELSKTEKTPEVIQEMEEIESYLGNL